MDSLEGYTDSNGNMQIKMKNKAKLKNQLNNLNFGGIISFDELDKAIIQINDMFSSGDLDNEYQINALSCSDLTTILGLIHSGQYGVAAVLLGVTGWGAFVPGFLIATVWAVASIIGCNL